jgi:hypothetical protein
LGAALAWWSESEWLWGALSVLPLLKVLSWVLALESVTEWPPKSAADRRDRVLQQQKLQLASIWNRSSNQS